MNRLTNRLMATAIACLAMTGAPAPAAAQANGDPEPALLELDRLHIDARRQLSLLGTLGEITTALDGIRPYGDAILVLLDDSRPMPERWRQVLGAPPPGLATGESSAVGEELVQLRSEVDALFETIAYMQQQSVSNSPWTEPDAPEPDGIEDPELVLQKQMENWQLDASAVRYAQLGTPSVSPAVWLDAPAGGRHLEAGRSTMVGKQAIRLDRVDRQRDGRLRLQFNLDGKPVSIDW